MKTKLEIILFSYNTILIEPAGLQNRVRGWVLKYCLFYY
jgi:hypothetical protein